MDFEEKLACAILRCQDIHEGSWDADKEIYRIDIKEAADKACEEEYFDLRMNLVVHLLNQYAWNDAQEWAKRVKPVDKDYISAQTADTGIVEENEIEPAKCRFQQAWQGPCTQDVVDKGFCSEHSKLFCASCGAKATHNCAETGQFVCGAPLCDDCEHTTAEDGTNGGTGFIQCSPYPEGFKAHCKKSEQVYTPWYVREENNIPQKDKEYQPKGDTQ